APVLVAGHSLGEFTALVAAGVLDFEEALLLVRERGRLMKETGEQRPGGMAAVIGLDEQVLAAIVAEAGSEGIVSLANNNSPGQTVLSGEIAALQRAMDLARAQGARLVQRLAVTIASHSPLMQQASQRFSHVVGQLTLRPPEVPLLSNVTAQALTSVDELRHELSAQLILPVQWTRSVQTAVAHGVDTFVELGPRQVLSGLIKRISRNVQSISLNDEALAKVMKDEGA
ncbi:MAG: ACP S-malonyltransferase, partial [Chloroflexales bacterium]|nr:ACP S-malonyltransferase [Chloroflexales bacterium]